MKKILSKYKNGDVLVTLLEDGTKIRYSQLDNPKVNFPESMDIKITDYCEMNCPYCHEKSTTDGKHGDLNMEFIDTLPSGIELAIGGGDPLSHPKLSDFLNKLRNKNIFPSITINQHHLITKWDKIKFLNDNGLVFGIGISITNPTDEVLDKVKQLKNPVLHVINGIVTKEQFEKIYDKGLKLLILGYKSYTGRGEEYYKEHSEEINDKFINKELLEELKKHFDVISFDNLALTQIPVREAVGEKIWAQSFMGEDGNHTMYIDLVKGEFARTSTSKERFKIKDNIIDMFEIVRV